MAVRVAIGREKPHRRKRCLVIDPKEKHGGYFDVEQVRGAGHSGAGLFYLGA